ncbi:MULTISPECIES: thermonuclease family protein [unclassified Bosea (in: a-proteobacteria)]|uniref:thermonuclease family protein n=1 Tax=unclassified Bosea (in: a-proteobacteria) TaxID=2653178 RepID=UPI000956FE94|nr:MULTISPECIES: thermonuclease family protein [unclassified Bosea (in: a-proteobacteria)]TAJ34285.1 MAG: thermonuclease family protein [Bosea sp. (in: a-proteobacteria)]SIQ00366.1 Endonuclease YncB, thermonuclease family [Bosea sp. TND4EK4]
MPRSEPGRTGPRFFGHGASGHGPFGWRRVGRFTDFVVALGLLGLVALAGAVLQYRLGPARGLAGPAQAIDGDSIRLLGEELRLEGLDAPEFRQTCRDGAGRSIACGREARRALQALLMRGETRCEIGKSDRYGRGLARCWQGEEEINAALVREGHAVAYGGYGAEEAQAKAARRGIWALDFERPEAWRRSHPR